MADLRNARSKQTTAGAKLENSCNLVSEMCAQDDGVKPTVIQLQRHIDKVKGHAEKYEATHDAYVVLLDLDSVQPVEDAFSHTYKKVEQTLERAINLIEDRTAKFDEQQKLEQAQPPIDRSKVKFTLGQRDAIVERAEKLLTTIQEKVASLDSIAAVQLQEDILTRVEVLADSMSSYTTVLYGLDAKSGEEFNEFATRKRIEFEHRVDDIRGQLSAIQVTLTPAPSPAPSPEPQGAHGGAGWRPASLQYKRADIPTFSGELRDYASFKREWLQGVQPHLELSTHVRQFKAAVAPHIRSDLKNFHDMDEIWEFMDERFADPMASSAEYVERLENFKYSKPVLTNHAKFQELTAAWSQAVNDMTELKCLEQLNQYAIIQKVVRNLPTDAMKSRYVEQRIAKLKSNKEMSSGDDKARFTELQVFTDFMKGERKQQEFLKMLNPSKEETEPRRTERTRSRERRRSPDRRRERSACYKCGGHHRAAECTASGSQKPAKRSHKTKRVANANMLIKPKDCPACKDQHPLHSKDKDGQTLYRTRLSVCLAFINMSVAARAALVEDVKGCAVCLDWTGSHTRQDCKETVNGKAYGSCKEASGSSGTCGKQHHRMLHGSSAKFCNYVQVNSVSRAAPSEAEIEDAEKVTSLMQMQKIKIEGNDEDAVVFFDSGSNINLVRAAYAKAAGWHGIDLKLSLQTTGRTADDWDTRAYHIPLIDVLGEVHTILAYEMETITAPLGPVDVGYALELFPGYSYEQLRRPEGKVDLLLGIHQAGIFPMIADRSKHVAGDLRLLTSQFGTGFLLDGTHKTVKAGCVHQTLVSHAKSRSSVVGRPVRLSHRVNRTPGFSFTECEELGVHQPRRCGACTSCRKCSDGAQQLSRKEQSELLMIEKGMELNEETQRVTFHYPLVKDPSVLSDNRGQAIAMAAGLERRLERNGQTPAYNAELKQFLERGVIRELTEEEMAAWTGPLNYISHHPVVKADSTTKLRIVSNSSLDNNNSGHNYNDLQAKGPNSLISLIDALIRWRSYQHCVVWDLVKAYNTVKTFVEELHMRRLVWRWGAASGPWTTFGIDVMHYGDRCAMAGLENARKLVADAGRHIDPAAADMIANGYVDDCVGGGSEDTVNRLVGEETWADGKPQYSGTVSRILEMGSFGVKVMVRSGETRPEVIELLGSGVLGLPWLPGPDIIVMHLSVNLTAKHASTGKGPDLTVTTIGELDDIVMTKRVVVSAVYSIYDPLGLIGPIVIKFKLLLQKLSGVDIGWDDKLETSLALEAKAALKEIVYAKDITFPRSVRPRGTKGNLELLGWWDGGDPASAACVYTRLELDEPSRDGETHAVTLLMAKTRVTPSAKGPELPRRSTPRTELRGLLILCRIVSACLTALKDDPPLRISLMGDSECTIAAVECEDGVLQTWFANRVAEILDHMASWEAAGVTVDPLHHWPGLRNIADIATKGKAELQDVSPSSEWQRGPWESRRPRSDWPATREFRRELPAGESRTSIVNSLQKVEKMELINQAKEIMNKFNEQMKVAATMARWLRATSGCRADILLAPTVHYLDTAFKLMFLIGTLETDAEVKAGRLDGLAPAWSGGRWVTRGRLGKSMFQVLGVSELPILLPGSRLAYLVMLQAHRQDHKSVTITLWRSRSGVWVVRGRRLAEKVVRECVLCKARRGVLQQQQMGFLPEERLAIGTRPFSNVCLDFLGPTLVKAMVNKRAQMKVWPLLIVCQATGALHTEVAFDYSTDAFLNCWEHFAAVRGHPSKVVSDRGSQLTSSRNSVAFTNADSPVSWDWAEVKARGARKGTTWEFVPAGAQFRNGLSEARVKAIKGTLDHMFASSLINVKPTLNYAELVTVLSQAANIINDRPIGAKVLTETDFVAITVNQLLLGRTSTIAGDVSAGDTVEEDFRAVRSYQDALLDTWWSLWRQQGLPTLLPYYRHKEAKRHVNLKVGDICLVLYENKVKGTYRLCRILDVTKSEGGVVRTVLIGFRARRAPSGHRLSYAALDQLEVAVQRLVLLVPSEEIEPEKVGVGIIKDDSDTADAKKKPLNESFENVTPGDASIEKEEPLYVSIEKEEPLHAPFEDAASGGAVSSRTRSSQRPTQAT
jgi:hypothetical protein